MSALIAASVVVMLIYLGLRHHRITATINARPLADRIDDLLPQTQCTQCGYSGCRPYAEAIARGAADINQCPPGGDVGVRALAKLLGVAPKPINPANGTAKQGQTVAVIDESLCIGCTLCIQACPVDAILGASKLMHTVVADECTGCELCLAPCPVDCIRMVPVKHGHAPAASASPVFHRILSVSARRTPAKEKADRARRRHQFRLQRLARDETERAARLAAKQRDASSPHDDAAEMAPTSDAIRAAVERARAKRAARPTTSSVTSARHGAQRE